MVGAGAVVVEDLPDHVVAIGVPARIQRELEGKDLLLRTSIARK
jgi:acetyltransferase-like isoleucine patch superfamily enzyme